MVLGTRRPLTRKVSNCKEESSCVVFNNICQRRSENCLKACQEGEGAQVTLVRWFCTVLLLVWAGLASAADASVGAYKLVSTRRLNDFESLYTYQASVTNLGGPLVSVSASARSVNLAITLTDGSLTFGDVAAGATVVSQDTFIIRKAPTQVFRPEDLVWTVTGTPGGSNWAGFTTRPATGAAPLDVRFTPVPLTDAAIVQYRWDLDGNGTTDFTDTIGREQSWRYTRPGTYLAALTILDSLGRTDKRIVNIVVNNASPVVTASASPTNGAAPLLVTLFASASDNEGVVKFEWDFEGDGTFDRVINGTSGNTSFTYTAPGNFSPRVRVTDALGVSTLYTDSGLAIRVGSVGSPRATLTLSPSGGAAPLAVRLTASVSDPQGKTVLQYEWDTNGDGTYDATTTTNVYDAIFSSAGTFYPRSRVTMIDGRVAVDTKTLKVSSSVGLRVGNDTVDIRAGQTTPVTTTLTAVTRVSLVVEPRGKAAIRTLLPPTVRNPGSYIDVWDGRNDAGQPVPEGVYNIVLLYEQDGKTVRYDPSLSTGGVEFVPTVSLIPTSFQPFNYNPLVIDLSLSRAAEVNAVMGDTAIDTRYVTFYARQPLGRGAHRIVWNGDSTNGQLISPSPGGQFVFGAFAYTLADNAVFVRNGVDISGLVSSPPIFDPTAVNSAGTRNPCTIQFDLNQGASVDLDVIDARTGVVVRKLRFASLPAGRNTVTWDGKASDGRYVAPGTYRLGASATQSTGYRSLMLYTLQRVNY